MNLCTGIQTNRTIGRRVKLNLTREKLASVRENLMVRSSVLNVSIPENKRKQR
jgi:hypothetical protein